MGNRSKSPKRKLSLETYDGKSYIKKKDLEHYYFNQHWSKGDFLDQFGIGHRIMNQSLNRYYTPLDLRKERSEKAKINQKSSNSNKSNWFIPRNLIPLDKLKKALSNSKTQKEALEKLGISKYILTHHLQYYKLFYKPRSQYKRLSNHDLSEREINILTSLAVLNSDITDITSENLPKRARAISDLSDLVFDIRILYKKLRIKERKCLRLYGGGFPTNITEYSFYKELKVLGLNPIPQYKVGNYYYDFLLKTGDILELDGNQHTLEKDNVKDNLALSKGHKVIRVNLDKRSKYHINKNVKTCIKNYVLPLLNQ